MIEKFLQIRQPVVLISLGSPAASLGVKNAHSLHTSLSTGMHRETKRVFVVRGTDRGRKAWYCVLLVDDPETIRIYKEKTQGEQGGTLTVDVTDYGEVLKSGFGEEPPQEVKDWLNRVLNGIEILPYQT